ncbi:Qat anti-phage system TatD family nuclease QatD [Asticcacaulis benevestitus]|uniref:Hydrolase TatD n=1 Tax=Asticcacaulis benevestitus DSM 16100 = ATCC BAA-896 TaxID=1121022 RepID=V4PQK5_9CAUL|nr:Qat anti-phage system TatD family nuclease QatD [Asticcacaulis benevestitus]ESQ87805.1 hypothetical protein ABENE_16770 [Asticcacaulis benevestitus DSM 16100 = ATCC BAA-896]
MNLVDFHCHLDLFPEFPDLVAECERRKIYTLTVTTTPRAWKRNFDLTQSLKFVRAALGLHPQLVAQHHAELDLFCALLPAAIYVGEIGIDGSREYAPSLPLQRRVFDQILGACAANGGRVMSIHSRGAVTEVLDSIEQNSSGGTAILHWFSGTPRQLERAVELGCCFSVGPKMLQGAKGIDLVGRMPQTRILTETDGPFARDDNGPLYPWAAETAISELAKIWKLDAMETREQICKNLSSLINQKQN